MERFRYTYNVGMVKDDTLPGEWVKYADAQAMVEALQRERDHAKKMEAVQTEVADNQTWHVRELRAALDAEREKVKRLSTCGTDHSTPWWQVRCEDLEEQLTQLKALVREVDSLLNGIIKRNQGGYVGDKDNIRKAISLIATLDATTPAPRQRQVHSCEIPGCVSCANPEEGGDGE